MYSVSNYKSMHKIQYWFRLSLLVKQRGPTHPTGFAFEFSLPYRKSSKSHSTNITWSGGDGITDTKYDIYSRDQLS